MKPREKKHVFAPNKGDKSNFQAKLSGIKPSIMKSNRFSNS
jgi:hypothetical protein